MADIASLLPPMAEVDCGNGRSLPVHGLRMDQVVELIVASQDVFLALYGVSQAAVRKGEEDMLAELSPILMAAPGVVARVISLASDSQGQENLIMQLPFTVQLIALQTIFKQTVPDPKKASELLSVVMGQLRKLSQRKAEDPALTTP